MGGGMHRLVRLKFIVLGWAAASLFFTAVSLVTDVGGHMPWVFALHSNAVHFALWALALPLLTRSTSRFRLDRGNKIWHGAVLLVIVAMVGPAVMLAQWAIVYSTCFPYRSEYPTFGLLVHSELARFLPVDILIGIVIVAVLQARRVWLDFEAEHTRVADLERGLALSRLEALRMQLHPHFLFNTLHTIAGLIVEQPSTARRMVVALGDLLRLTLKDEAGSLRSLAEELEFADLYLGIEKLRLGDRLVLDYDIDPEATSAQVPQLLLQPLFENAIRHGVSRMPGPCQILFSAHRVGDQLEITLCNDGPLRSESSELAAAGVGLTNTMARLRLHYENQFVFQYSDRPKGGVRIDLTLPYHNAGPERSDAHCSEDLYASSSSAAHARSDH